ncbi:MAG TPA: SdrD B-like domain-containing protein [Candidatus Krumholzibacteria bacterium]|nr:SdrD B-like domain-containing protein [Candidatus Krumholzibacteria bacterium]
MRTWNRPPIIALLFSIALALLAGCSQQDAPVFSPTKTSPVLSADVSPYTLVFISRAYDSENNQTTFTYQLQNTGSTTSEPASGVLGVFTTVMLELPSCAPAPDSYAPSDGASIYTNANGIYGIEWGVGYDNNPDLYFSVVFPGDIPSGVVRDMVSTGGYNYIQNVTGPCEGTFSVGGYVFSDGNSNGFKDLNELGIPNVTVTLSDGVTTEHVKTDSDGAYLFVAMAGNYTVSVDSMTADSDFNETLYQTWSATTPKSHNVSVGPDSYSNNFGWEPNIDNIIAGIDDGTYPTDGKSYKWWRKEFLRAIDGNTNTAYTPEQLVDFAHQIQALALLDEYNFTPGHELEEIYNILNNHAFGDDDGSSIMLQTKVDKQGRHDAYAYLVRELLTTELNHVSGRGLDDKVLQAVLIGWGEEVLNDNAPSALVIGDGFDPNLNYQPLDGAGTTFTKINGATGGGGTGN